jgi:succinate dehydrogenase / fumarate reductase cytochrome b subunit
VKTFRFGPGIEEGYAVSDPTHGPMRDLHRVVVETFQSPYWVAGYVLAMLLLGSHLRHGFWSAFQSLGLAYPKYSKAIYGFGVFLATLLAVGFLFIPVYMHFSF